MANESLVDIKGLAELDKLLKDLPVKVERNVIRGALRAGQKTMQDAAKAKLRQNGSVRTGELERSIRIRFRRKSERFGWVRSYLIAGNKKAWYAHLIEYGTGSFYTGTGNNSKKKPYDIKPKNRKSLFFAGIARKLVTHPGIEPRPFMRPAWDATNQQSVDSIAEYIRTRRPKEIKKAGI